MNVLSLVVGVVTFAVWLFIMYKDAYRKDLPLATPKSEPPESYDPLKSMMTPPGMITYRPPVKQRITDPIPSVGALDLSDEPLLNSKHNV